MAVENAVGTEVAGSSVGVTGVAVGVSDAVGDGAGELLAVAVALAVGDELGVGVVVSVGVAEDVCVAVAVGVAAFVATLPASNRSVSRPFSFAGRSVELRESCTTRVTVAIVFGPSHVAASSGGASDVQWKMTSPSVGSVRVQSVAPARTPWSAMTGGANTAGSYVSSNSYSGMIVPGTVSVSTSCRMTPFCQS